MSGEREERTSIANLNARIIGIFLACLLLLNAPPSFFLRVDIHLPDSIPWPIARRPLVFSTEADAREACDFMPLKAPLEYLSSLASLSLVISGLSNRCEYIHLFFMNCHTIKYFFIENLHNYGFENIGMFFLQRKYFLFFLFVTFQFSQYHVS